VRIKVCRKDYGWSVGLVYDPKGLPGVTTVRPGVAGVLQKLGMDPRVGQPVCYGLCRELLFSRAVALLNSVDGS
jgi:hypothetical protein